ncbi:MAG: TRAP transporter small permease [Clostridia bacterium]|nr:TRAP transporter small permease [Clostridia bacterium]
MKILAKIEETLIGILLLVATIVLFANVVLRTFNHSTVWAEEFIRYAMIWITFIGSAICFRKNIHFGVDVILRIPSKLFVKVIKCLIIILSGLFSFYVLRYGIQLTLFAKEMGQIAPASQIQLYLIYMVLPIGAALSIIYLVRNLIYTIKDIEINPPEEIQEEK